MKTVVEMPQQKKIFVILGMARTGTSVLTRGIKALGIDLGDRLTPASKWNPRGFWEDNEIVYQVNEKVLIALGSSWDGIPFFTQIPETETFQKLKNTAIRILENRFSKNDIWAFKDPRTARILTFWQTVFTALSLQDNYIISLRNPLSAARSYQRLTGADIEHGLLLWITHLIAAINLSEGKNRIIVSYDLLMKEPKNQLLRIKNDLKIPGTQQIDEINHYVKTFLDNNLKHYETSLADLKTHTATKAAPLCVDMYACLSQVVNNEYSLNSPEFKQSWQEINDKLQKQLPVYDYIDKLLQRNAMNQQYIHGLHKSRLWKLMYPLRKIDSTLRQYRRQRTHCL